MHHPLTATNQGATSRVHAPVQPPGLDRYPRERNRSSGSGFPEKERRTGVMFPFYAIRILFCVCAYRHIMKQDETYHTCCGSPCSWNSRRRSWNIGTSVRFQPRVHLPHQPRSRQRKASLGEPGAASYASEPDLEM